MPPSPSRLFHTVVVVGASLGCGETVALPADPIDGGAAREASNPAPDAAPAAKPDGSSGPTSYCDCARPGTFRCEGCASGVGPIDGRCPNEDGVECSCDESIQIATPSDCAVPAQFTCQEAPNVDAGVADLHIFPLDWFEFAECTCNTAAPLNVSDCADAGPHFWSCVTGDNCPAGSKGAITNIQYACDCVPPPITIR
jgi:hypothetical protein